MMRFADMRCMRLVLILLLGGVPGLASAVFLGYEANANVDVILVDITDAAGQSIGLLPPDVIVTELGTIANTFAGTEASSGVAGADTSAFGSAFGSPDGGITIGDQLAAGSSGVGFIFGEGPATATTRAFGGAVIGFENHSETDLYLDLVGYFSVDALAIADGIDGTASASAFALIGADNDLGGYLGEEFLVPEGLSFLNTASLDVEAPPINSGGFSQDLMFRLPLAAGSSLDVMALAGTTGVATIPLPPAVLFLGNGLLVLLGIAWRRIKA